MDEDDAIQFHYLRVNVYQMYFPCTKAQHSSALLQLLKVGSPDMGDSALILATLPGLVSTTRRGYHSYVSYDTVQDPIMAQTTISPDLHPFEAPTACGGSCNDAYVGLIALIPCSEQRQSFVLEVAQCTCPFPEQGSQRFSEIGFAISSVSQFSRRARREHRCAEIQKHVHPVGHSCKWLSTRAI